MDNEVLITVTIPTKYGTIYSAKIIDQHNFYIQTLKEADIKIKFDYVNNDSEEISINDIVNLFIINDKTNPINQNCAQLQLRSDWLSNFRSRLTF